MHIHRLRITRRLNKNNSASLLVEHTAAFNPPIPRAQLLFAGYPPNRQCGYLFYVQSRRPILCTRLSAAQCCNFLTGIARRLRRAPSPQTRGRSRRSAAESDGRMLPVRRRPRVLVVGRTIASSETKQRTSSIVINQLSANARISIASAWFTVLQTHGAVAFARTSNVTMTC
jgi:hypothetical protein